MGRLVDFSSAELASVEHTVVEPTAHEFLLEAVHDLYNHNVQKIQLGLHKAIEDVIVQIAEARKKQTLGHNTEVSKLQKRLKSLREGKDRAIARMQMLRDATIASLKEWEEFGVD